MSEPIAISKQPFWRNAIRLSEEIKPQTIYNARDYCENCCPAERQVSPGEKSSPGNSQKVKVKRRLRPSIICTTNCRYEILRDVAEYFGMKESTEGWNVYWTDLSITHERCKEMKRYQRINHFPGMLEICRKDLLARNLNRMQKCFPNDYNFYPKSWCLPTEINEVIEYHKINKNKPLIVKPDIGCQGRGIFITKNITDLKELDKMICQVYMSKPFLLDGYKFDLRVYVLMTSCDPLRIYVYNEGLVRFATKKYKEPSNTNISNMYMHLTNYSVNKHSRAYVNDAEGGSKRRISTLNHQLMDLCYNTEKLWKAVDDVIIKTVIVALPCIKHSYQVCFPNHITTQACFELLGFDFILDNKLNPYLLEVNHSPSFHTETELDMEVKETLLKDTFKLLNLPKNDKHKIINEDKKRMKERLLGTGEKKGLSEKCEERCKLHEACMKEIFEWESTHLGNFRQVYPCENEKQYEIFLTTNLNPMYTDSQASRVRENFAKMQRDETLYSIKSRSSEVKTTDDKKIILPLKKTELSICSSFEPVLIDEEEEMKRLAELKKRETVLINHGVMEKIYEGLKEAGKLQIEDQIRYGRENGFLTNGCNEEMTKKDNTKKKIEDIFRIISCRRLLHTSQELPPITETLIRLTEKPEETNIINTNVISKTVVSAEAKISPRNEHRDRLKAMLVKGDMHGDHRDSSQPAQRSNSTFAACQVLQKKH